MLLAKIVLVLAITCVNAGLLPSLGMKRRSSSSTTVDENEEEIKENNGHRGGRRKLLPKVVPHPDSWLVSINIYLQFFHYPHSIPIPRIQLLPTTKVI